jgi:hypothetical protein
MISNINTAGETTFQCSRETSAKPAYNEHEHNSTDNGLRLTQESLDW